MLKPKALIVVKTGDVYKNTADKIVRDGAIALVVRGSISPNAKQVLRENNIAFAEHVGV